MSVVSVLLDLLLHRPRGIAGKPLEKAPAGGGNWGPMDAPKETGPSPRTDGAPDAPVANEAETEER